MAEKIKELRPIKESTEDFDKIEAKITAEFRRLLYGPLIDELKISPLKKVKNSQQDLIDAIASGKVTYSRGAFRGKFSASVSRELKSIGAVWDMETDSFKIELSTLQGPLRSGVMAAESRFIAKLGSIQRKLSEISPKLIADNIQVAHLFDRTLWKTEKEIDKTLKGISVPAQITPSRREKISVEYQKNLELWIKTFAEEEIIELRKTVTDSAFAGNRWEHLVKGIQESYGVTTRKAKFLARQETSLLLAKFKEARYTDSGVNEYRWGCVTGSKNHPVRPSHEILNGKIFRWDEPPITTMPNQPARRNNPGQDYNCRCFARPLVKFDESTKRS